MEHSVKHWITEKAQLWWKEAWFGRKYFDESEADLSFLVLTLLDRDVCDVLLFWVVLVRGSLRGWAFFVLSVHFSIKTWSSGIKTSTMSSPQSQQLFIDIRTVSVFVESCMKQIKELSFVDDSVIFWDSHFVYLWRW